MKQKNDYRYVAYDAANGEYEEFKTVKEAEDWLTENDYAGISDKPYSYHMGRDIEALLECDAVYLAPGWHNSKGCTAEYEVARIYGKEIYT